MNEQNDIMDLQHQLQNRLWAGEYYSEGRPIVRLLGDLTIELCRRAIGEGNDG